MIKVEIHLFCSPYFPNSYWLKLVVDNNVLKTINHISKDKIDDGVKTLRKYANTHKDFIKKLIKEDVELKEYSELYHIKVLTSNKWRA